MRTALSVLVVLAAAGAAFAYVHETEPGWYERLRYPLSYEEIVRGHAKNYDLDAALLAAVIYRESKFNASARSSSGAIGLMQLLPETANGIALHTGGTQFEVDDLYDPEINVRYGAFYLHRLLNKYGDTRLALAAYNAGQRNVDTWIAEGEGIQFSETRAYVDSVLDLRKIYRDAYAERLGYSAGSSLYQEFRMLGRYRLRGKETPPRARCGRSGGGATAAAGLPARV
jgi:soluble lytic murein transglycosylase